MKSNELQAIADTLLRIVKVDMSPKQLLKAVHKKHPKASKKRIVRAAFYAVIANAGREPAKSARLHDFALTERAPTVADTSLDGEKPKKRAGNKEIGRLWNPAR